MMIRVASKVCELAPEAAHKDRHACAQACMCREGCGEACRGAGGERVGRTQGRTLSSLGLCLVTAGGDVPVTSVAWHVNEQAGGSIAAGRMSVCCVCMCVSGA